MHLVVDPKRLKDKYKDPDVLPKVNKAHMAETMESIKEYLRSCHGVVKAPLAHVITKTITVKSMVIILSMQFLTTK